MRAPAGGHQRSESATGYFVGRRQPGGVEIYLVDRDGVERIRSERHDDGALFDWCLGPDGPLELSYVLLLRVGGQQPPPDLQVLFARILSECPPDGFILRADVLADWLRASATIHPSIERQGRRSSLLDRIRAAVKVRARRSH